jgi:hypothetical protein
MIFEGINIGFLWEDINEKILDAPNPFDEKWRDEKIKYRDFNKKGPLEKVLQLLIIAYKDNSPREMFYIGKNGDSIIKDNLIVQLKEHLARADIEKFTKKEKEIKGLDITIERLFEFVGTHNFVNMVETTLSGKSFIKNVVGDKTIFVVNNSPIGKIELTPKSFMLKLNEDVYEFLY